MAKKRIHVLRPFTLNLPGANGKPHYHKFPAGIHFVDEELADHWYTQVHIAHSEKEVKLHQEKAMDEVVKVTEHEPSFDAGGPAGAQEHEPAEEEEEDAEDQLDAQGEEEAAANAEQALPGRRVRRGK